MVLFDGYSRCVEALDNGDVDAVTTDNVILMGFIAESPGEYKLVESGTFTEEPYGIGLKKGDDEFRNWINDVIEEVVADGRYNQAWERTAGKFDPELPTAADGRPVLSGPGRAGRWRSEPVRVIVEYYDVFLGGFLAHLPALPAGRGRCSDPGHGAGGDADLAGAAVAVARHRLRQRLIRNVPLTVVGFVVVFALPTIGVRADFLRIPGLDIVFPRLGIDLPYFRMAIFGLVALHGGVRLRGAAQWHQRGAARAGRGGPGDRAHLHSKSPARGAATGLEGCGRPAGDGDHRDDQELGAVWIPGPRPATCRARSSGWSAPAVSRPSRSSSW